jgi:hypothetical protein
MDTVYYSKNCLHCQKLLQYLAKHGFTNKCNFLCIDRRQRDQTTGQTYILLERGVKVLLPANVQNVPSLVCSSTQNYKVLVGNDIYQYIQYRLQGLINDATNNNGEPSGYPLAQMTAMTEQFTYYSMTPQELSSKGNGGMRQLLNYVPATIAGPVAMNGIGATPAQIQNQMPGQGQMQGGGQTKAPMNGTMSGINRLEPRDDGYRSEKLKADDIDMESLMQRRNAEISIPPLGSGGPNPNNHNPVYAPRGPPSSTQYATGNNASPPPQYATGNNTPSPQYATGNNAPPMMYSNNAPPPQSMYPNAPHIAPSAQSALPIPYLVNI